MVSTRKVTRYEDGDNYSLRSILANGLVAAAGGGDLGDKRALLDSGVLSIEEEDIWGQKALPMAAGPAV